jgi:putative redox protein
MAYNGEFWVGNVMECTVKWIDGMAFAAQTGSGHLLTMDGAVEGGGLNLAPRPMELLLAGAGGCTAYDVLLILKRGRHQVSDCAVSLKAERADSDPKVFTKIHFHYTLRGKGLKAEVIERAIALSSEKYCSASIMLGKTATISHDFEIIEEE